jgi:NADH-quinone oxidoreductase subunit N
MAYSSISHAGYILLGVVAALTGDEGNETAMRAIGLYLLIYAFMTVGAFAVIITLRRQGVIGDELDDLNGLIRRNPTAAVLLLIFMLSLAGIPPLAGFIGKYYILLSLIQTGHYYLAAAGALYIVPALYYYFRVVVHAWLKEPAVDQRTGITAAQSVALAVMGVVIVAVGVYPEPFIRMATYSMTLPSALFGR